MEFISKTGEEIDKEYLKKIMALDAIVYAEQGMAGELEQMEKRFEANPETFVVIEEKETGEFAGYVNFFPVVDEVYKQIMWTSDEIRDDDIMPEELAPYRECRSREERSIDSKERDKQNENLAKDREDIIKTRIDEGKDHLRNVLKEETAEMANRGEYLVNRPDNIYKVKRRNHIYVISVATHEKFRGKDSVAALTNAWIDYLNKLGDRYGFIERDEDGKVSYVDMDITGTTVSDGGRRFMRNNNFQLKRQIIDEEHPEVIERVCICEEDYLIKLLNEDTYIKSYKDDVYIMLPFADNLKNNRAEELFRDKLNDKSNSIPCDEEANTDDNISEADDKGAINVIRKSFKRITDKLFKESKTSSSYTPNDNEKVDNEKEKDDDLNADDIEANIDECLENIANFHGDKKKRAEAEEKLRSIISDDIPFVFLDDIDNCIKYELDNAVVNDLENIYLDKFSLLITSDDYPVMDDKWDGNKEYLTYTEYEDKKKGKIRKLDNTEYLGTDEDSEIIIGEEEVHLFLTAHKNTRMYVLTMFIPNCSFSTSQIEDQMSYGYLKIRNKDNPNKFIRIEDYLRAKYGLISCGKGKCLVCMSERPKIKEGKSDEFLNIMSAEVYNSMHQDFHISGEKVKEWATKSYAQYDYYDVYLSDTVVAYIPTKEFGYDSNIKRRIDLMATYAFIVELTMLQNTALARTNYKVSNALCNDGKISNTEILNLYEEFGKTVHFWEKHNYKYSGTQLEAECIMSAFGNEELKAAYTEYQDYLGKIVELQVSEESNRNSNILNIAVAFLTIVSIRDFIKDILSDIAMQLGISDEFRNLVSSGIDNGKYFLDKDTLDSKTAVDYLAGLAINKLLIGVAAFTTFTILIIVHKKKNVREKNFHTK